MSLLTQPTTLSIGNVYRLNEDMHVMTTKKIETVSKMTADYEMSFVR